MADLMGVVASCVHIIVHTLCAYVTTIIDTTIIGVCKLWMLT